MTARIVGSAWWFLVMSFIAFFGLGGTFAAYWGIEQIIGGQWNQGMGAVASAFVLAGITWILCRHRTDLI